jgi:hypothetical protein
MSACAADAPRSRYRRVWSRSSSGRQAGLRVAWSVAAAACRASGMVAWAARVQEPGLGEPIWLSGRAESQPPIVQSECVPALIAALDGTPIGAAVEVFAPTSLRYSIAGAAFPPDSPERRLAESRRQVPDCLCGGASGLRGLCLRRLRPVADRIGSPPRSVGVPALACALISPHASAPRSFVFFRGQGLSLLSLKWLSFSQVLEQRDEGRVDARGRGHAAASGRRSPTSPGMSCANVLGLDLTSATLRRQTLAPYPLSSCGPMSLRYGTDPLMDPC